LCSKKDKAIHRIVVLFWGAKPPEDHGLKRVVAGLLLEDHEWDFHRMTLS